MLADPDFKQHEFCWMIEYAAKMGLRGARATAKILRDDPKADFHAMVAEMAGLDDRHTAKSVNFAKIYGAGVKRLAAMIGKSVAETQAILAQYDEKLPFVSELDVFVKERANRLGYTAMIDGAPALALWTLDLQGQGGRRQGREGPCEIEEARRRRDDPVHPWYRQRLRRYRTYTALNALIQGTAARHTKLWMREVWRAGIVPLLQMHDSLICSVTSREQGELVARLGRECVKLEEVPMRTDLKYGRNWDDAKHTWEELADEPAHVNGSHASHAAGPTVAAEPAIEVASMRRPQRRSILATSRPTDGGRGTDDATLDCGHGRCDLADIIGGGAGATSQDPLSRSTTRPDAELLTSYHDHRSTASPAASTAHRIGWLMQASTDCSYAEATRHPRQLGRRRGVGAGADRVRRRRPTPERIARALKMVERGRADRRHAGGALPGRRSAGSTSTCCPADVSERALRFHPACVFGPGDWHPCLLALMRDPVTGAPTGIQRIALTWDARRSTA